MRERAPNYRITAYHGQSIQNGQGKLHNRNGRGLLLIFQNISGLAFQGFADRFQCRQPDRFHFAILQHRDIRHRDAHFIRKLRDGHFSLSQHDVDVNDDRHIGLDS